MKLLGSTTLSVAVAIFGADLTGAVACPVINGKYVKKFEKDGIEYRRTQSMETVVQNGKVMYRFLAGEGDDRRLYPVDNVARPLEIAGRRGLIQLRCSGEALIIEMRGDGSQQTVT